MKCAVVTQWVIPVEYRENPTWLKRSRQVSSETRVQSQQWKYGAGWSKGAGCGIEPRNTYCGHEDNQALSELSAWESRRLYWVRKAAVQDALWQCILDTTGVEEQGMYSEG